MGNILLRFTRVPKSVSTQWKILGYANRVLNFTISEYYSDEHHVAYPTIEQLCESSGLTKSHLYRLLKDQERKFFVVTDTLGGLQKAGLLRDLQIMKKDKLAFLLPDLLLGQMAYALEHKQAVDNNLHGLFHRAVTRHLLKLEKHLSGGTQASLRQNTDIPLKGCTNPSEDAQRVPSAQAEQPLGGHLNYTIGLYNELGGRFNFPTINELHILYQIQNQMRHEEEVQSGRMKVLNQVFA